MVYSVTLLFNISHWAVDLCRSLATIDPYSVSLSSSPGHDIKLHPHRVKLYRIMCVGSGLVLVKALT